MECVSASSASMHRRAVSNAGGAMGAHGAAGSRRRWRCQIISNAAPITLRGRVIAIVTVVSSLYASWATRIWMAGGRNGWAVAYVQYSRAYTGREAAARRCGNRRLGGRASTCRGTGAPGAGIDDARSRSRNPRSRKCWPASSNGSPTTTRRTAFCVLRIKARGHRDVVTVVGHAAAIAAGEWITASGEWVNDRTHGQQFKTRFMRTSAPTSIDGIEKYLALRHDPRHRPGLRQEAVRTRSARRSSISSRRARPAA